VLAVPASATQPFDAQGHRGARGLRPENTLSSFAKALQVGVTTLELDTGISQDGEVVVSHDPRISTEICVDTHPVRPGDPEYPYVGDLIVELTLRQIKTVDCGRRAPADFAATQVEMPGSRIPTLSEVFGLAKRYEANEVRFNIETKIDPTAPGETVGPRVFVRRVVDVIEDHDAIGRSMLQSFDWRTLVAARRLKRALRLVALGDETTFQLSEPGASPWLAGIDVDVAPFDGDAVKATRAIGAKVLSVDHTFLTDEMIASAHHRDMLVVPWTVNDAPTMRALIARGVDGLITDYPQPATRRHGGGRAAAARGTRAAAVRRAESPRRALGPSGEHPRGLPLRPQGGRRHARARHRRDGGRHPRRAARPRHQRRSLQRHGTGNAQRSRIPLRR
jgi:glycerophosphoryl diester phosphodiesterase